jgi:CPA2 family monovalent cation:H+ antiporter-2
LQERFPTLPVIVRTVDDADMDKLRDAGATEVVPEILEGSLMLASHALVLLGVPLNRVVKRIRVFREERYKMFKGYFHGVSDVDTDALEKHQSRMHSVVIPADAFIVSHYISSMNLDSISVEVTSVRRPSMHGVELGSDAPLQEGDVVVLLGEAPNIIKAENALLTGRIGGLKKGAI